MRNNLLSADDAWKAIEAKLYWGINEAWKAIEVQTRFINDAWKAIEGDFKSLKWWFKEGIY